jgi:hypothetical protein
MPSKYESFSTTASASYNSGEITVVNGEILNYHVF